MHRHALFACEYMMYVCLYVCMYVCMYVCTERHAHAQAYAICMYLSHNAQNSYKGRYRRGGGCYCNYFNHVILCSIWL